MLKVKGKFISLAGYLMSSNKNAKMKCDALLYEKIERTSMQLDPEEWYDNQILTDFIKIYSDFSEDSEQAIICLGKKVYPLIKQTIGLPEFIKSPLDLMLFEAEGFLQNNKGEGIIPRKFIKKEEGHVIVQAPAPIPTKENQKLFEGVFLGILQMYGIKTGKVVMTKGTPFFEYEITW